MYGLLTFGGEIDQEMMEVWKSRISLKLKHFLFLAVSDRTQCVVQLIEKKRKRRKKRKKRRKEQEKTPQEESGGE
jgi:non-homologous end joining protein Ku